MAQEGERRRIARELHDEVGQTLTGVVLQLEGVHRAARGELAEQVGLVQETARERCRAGARDRPRVEASALDEFGLRSALATLATASPSAAGCRSGTAVSTELPQLAPEQDLAIYRGGAGEPDQRRAPRRCGDRGSCR